MREAPVAPSPSEAKSERIILRTITKTIFFERCADCGLRTFLLLSLFSCAPLFGCFSRAPSCFVAFPAPLLVWSLASFSCGRDLLLFLLVFLCIFCRTEIFLRVFHHGCRRSAYPRFVFSATQNPSVNPKNYDENGDFCNFPPDEPKTTMKTAIFAFSRSTLHFRFPRF